MLAAGLVALAAPAAAAGADLLGRHRPLLRYDRDERHFATSVSSLTEAAILEREQGPRVNAPGPAFLGDRYGDGRRAGPGDRLRQVRPVRGGPALVYGRSARDRDERIWLQYWLFFADNTQDRGIFRTGRHTGDWELVQVRLGAGRRPVEVTLAQHTWAEGCGWTEMERVGDAPVVYVANGSHALLSRPGTSDRPFPDPNDEADGRGRRVRPQVERVSAARPRWMAWPGRWAPVRRASCSASSRARAGRSYSPSAGGTRAPSTPRRPLGAGPGRPPATGRLAAGLLVAVRSYKR